MIRLSGGKGMNSEKSSPSLGSGAWESENVEKETGC